jgi:hypothetical protein
VTFLKRSAARLERPKTRVNPYDDSFFGGSSPTMRPSNPPDWTISSLLAQHPDNLLFGPRNDLEEQE